MSGIELVMPEVGIARHMKAYLAAYLQKVGKHGISKHNMHTCDEQVCIGGVGLIQYKNKVLSDQPTRVRPMLFISFSLLSVY